MNQQSEIARLENSIELQRRTLDNLLSGSVVSKPAVYLCQELIASFTQQLEAVRAGFRNYAALLEHKAQKRKEQEQALREMEHWNKVYMNTNVFTEEGKAVKAKLAEAREAYCKAVEAANPTWLVH